MAVVTIMRYACETVSLVNLESKFELVSTALVSLREAPPKKKRVHLGIAQKGGGVETLAQIVFGSSSVI